MSKKNIAIAIILCFIFSAVLSFAKGGGGSGGNGGGGNGGGSSGNGAGESNKLRDDTFIKSYPSKFMVKENVSGNDKVEVKKKVMVKKKALQTEKVLKKNSNIENDFFKKLDGVAEALDGLQISEEEEARLIENSWGD